MITQWWRWFWKKDGLLMVRPCENFLMQYKNKSIESDSFVNTSHNPSLKTIAIMKNELKRLIPDTNIASNIPLSKFLRIETSVKTMSELAIIRNQSKTGL